MNQIRVSDFGGPEVLQVTQAALPVPTFGECLIRLHACGVNPVDTYIRSGNYPVLPNLPYCPGKDGAGTIEAIVGNFKDLKVGDRVYICGARTGTYAQYCVCDARHVFKFPDNLSYAQGACLGVKAFTAFRALFDKAKAKPGEKVFIHGASGGVGLVATQIAKASGMTVIGTAGTPEGAKVSST